MCVWIRKKWVFFSFFFLSLAVQQHFPCKLSSRCILMGISGARAPAGTENVGLVCLCTGSMVARQTPLERWGHKVLSGFRIRTHMDKHMESSQMILVHGKWKRGKKCVGGQTKSSISICLRLLWILSISPMCWKNTELLIKSVKRSCLVFFKRTVALVAFSRHSSYYHLHLSDAISV